MLALIALTLLTAASAHKPRDPSGFLLLSPELERSVAPRDDLPDFIPFSGVDPLPEYDVTSPNVLGLGLDKRQSCGNWGMCSDGGCAPPGSRCCGNRRYCPPGSFCNSIGGGCCPNGVGVCDNGSCAPFSANCCSSRGYCEAGYYCTTGGCCRNGQTCSGYGGGVRTSTWTVADVTSQTYNVDTVYRTSTYTRAETTTTTRAYTPPADTSTSVYVPPVPSTTSTTTTTSAALPTFAPGNYTPPLPSTSYTPAPSAVASRPPGPLSGAQALGAAVLPVMLGVGGALGALVL